MARPIEATPELNKEESLKILKNMKRVEEGRLTKAEIQFNISFWKDYPKLRKFLDSI